MTHSAFVTPRGAGALLARLIVLIAAVPVGFFALVSSLGTEDTDYSWLNMAALVAVGNAVSIAAGTVLTLLAIEVGY